MARPLADDVLDAAQLHLLRIGVIDFEDPHAAKAVSVLVNNIVGAGIMPRAASGDAALDREVDRLFEIWARGCDSDGQLDFYGLQTLACREMVEAGEVLVRRRPRRPGDGVMPPVQLQLLEAYVALDAHGQAAGACALWKSSAGAEAKLDPRLTSPKIRAACGVDPGPAR